MAGVTCNECRAYVTVRGLTKCPICQAPIAPIADSRAYSSTSKHPTPEAVQAQAFRSFGTSEALGVIIVAAIAISFAVFLYSSTPSESSSHRQAVSAALYQCQKAIHMTAQYGDADMPPYVKNNGTKGEFYFAWPRGSFEFSNGFGAREKMSASCIGDLESGEIKSLTINAKDIL